MYHLNKRKLFTNINSSFICGQFFYIIFNFIITKEISRFARETLDSTQYTRKLLEYGVGILFQYDHINTFNTDSKLRFHYD